MRELKIAVGLSIVILISDSICNMVTYTKTILTLLAELSFRAVRVEAGIIIAKDIFFASCLIGVVHAHSGVTRLLNHLQLLIPT